MFKIQSFCILLLLLTVTVGWAQYEDELYTTDDAISLEDDYIDQTPIDVLQFFEEGQSENQTHQFRNGWSDAYQGNEFDYNRVSPDNEKDFVTPEPVDVGFFKTIGFILKILGYLAIFVIVALVIRSFAQNGGIISSRAKSKKSQYEILEENLVFDEANYFSMSQKAKTDGLFPLAVRYYFLAYLQQLHKEKIIDYHLDKSNLDYRYEIDDLQIRSDFSTLSRVFDYCWYSEQDLSKEQFNSAEQLFLQIMKK